MRIHLMFHRALNASVWIINTMPLQKQLVLTLLGLCGDIVVTLRMRYSD